MQGVIIRVFSLCFPLFNIMHFSITRVLHEMPIIMILTSRSCNDYATKILLGMEIGIYC